MAETKRSARIIIRFSRWGNKLHFYPIDAFLAELTWFGSAAIDGNSSATALLDSYAATRFTPAQAIAFQSTLDAIIAKAATAMPEMEPSSPGVNDPFKQWAKAQIAPFEGLL